MGGDGVQMSGRMISYLIDIAGIYKLEITNCDFKLG